MPMTEQRRFEGSLGAGDRIGPYAVVRRIGSGGMGTVYLCKAAESCPVPAGKQVAVKILRSAEGDERKRFERESRYLQTLQHPGIVRVLDTGEDHGRLYLVMPLIDGKRLDDLVGPKHPPLAEEKAIDWMVQALEALHVAHLAGILHRDIKPGNLMLDKDGRIRLLDFGLASAPDAESRMTRSGDVVGTPAYMAPEQASGRREELSRRSDIYAMGACLYELLTGRQPFEADNAMATLRAIIDEPLRAPSKLRPDLAHDLETVVLVAMAKDQRDRYRTAEEMAGDLRRIRNGLRIRARRMPVTVHLWRQAVRNRRSLASIALVVFLLGSAATIITLRALRQARDDDGLRPQPSADAWIDELGWPGAAGDAALTWSDHPPFGDGAQITHLPSVEGSVRLSATVVLAADASATGGGTMVQLLVNDRDIGSGYSLRLDLDADGEQVLLLRENHIVVSRPLEPRLPRGSPIALSLEQTDGRLQVSVERGANRDGEPFSTGFSFFDLAPLTGSDARDVYLMRRRGVVDVNRVLLQRQRSGELVTGLAAADALRQDKRYARAQQLYLAFLRDQPDSPLARDAKLRLGLCQEALEDYQSALKTFVQVIEENRNLQTYNLVATFHAWSCAFRLGRFTEAEGHYNAIRRYYDDLQAIAVAIPQSTLTEMYEDFSKRAQANAGSEPERARNLAFSAAEIARFLERKADYADQTMLGGDLLVAGRSLELAIETYRRIAVDDGLPVDRRLAAQVRIAHTERLNGAPEAASASYRKALDLAPAGERGRIRLWQGDLAADFGQLPLAEATWTERDPGGDPATQRLLHVLARHTDIIPASDKLLQDPDAAYVNARVLLIKGDQDGALLWLTRIGSQQSALRWPVPLARALVARMQAAGRQGPETPQPEP